jgi:hypothetical protein
MSFNGLRLNLKASLISRQIIAPFERVYFTKPNFISSFSTGLDKNLGIVNLNLDYFTKNLILNRKYRELMLHWGEGVSISETRLIELMLCRIKQNGGEYKGLKNESDVLRYYEEFDQIYEKVKYQGLEIPKNNANFLNSKFEMNGIVIDINDNGKLIFTGRGTHRLAMAKSASLQVVPIYLRKIHLNSLRNKVWQKYLITIDS